MGRKKIYLQSCIRQWEGQGGKVPWDPVHTQAVPTPSVCRERSRETPFSAVVPCSGSWNDPLYFPLTNCISSLAHYVWPPSISYPSHEADFLLPSFTQLCPTLCNPMHYSLPGSSVHGILQARILKWVGVPFSRGSSRSRDRTQVSCIAGGFIITRKALFLLGDHIRMSMHAKED